MALDENYILLVEDNKNDEILTIRSFKKNNILNEIVVVRDGEEALLYLFETKEEGRYYKNPLPQLILLDLKLPKIDGIEVLKKIRGNKRTKLLPVVILTSSEEESDLLSCYNSGANSYIQKPVGFDDFTIAIQRLGIYWLLLNKGPPQEKSSMYADNS